MLDRFIDSLWLEDGLSKNTLEAYRRDLRLFAEWLAIERRTLTTATDAEVGGYLAHRFRGEAKLRASSQARLLSSLKRFYGFAVRERVLNVDPTLKIDPPKRTPRFPKTMTEADVEALLATPNIETPLGLRDRAMLETLYASGLRVSELVQLKLVEVSLDQGVVRIFGKGAKERLVPLGDEAAHWIMRYAKIARNDLRIDPRSGETVAVTDEGLHQSSFEVTVEREEGTTHPPQIVPNAWDRP